MNNLRADIATEVVTAYAKGGQMSDYQRQQCKEALSLSRGKEPEQAYAIALRFLGRMLNKAERDLNGEMIDLARKHPLDPEKCRIAEALADAFVKEAKR
jgi:hypothetical protein